MKKKLVSTLLCATMVAGCLSLAGCGGGGDTSTSGGAADDGAGTAADDGAGTAADDGAGTAADSSAEGGESEAAADFNETFGDANGTHMELWTFVPDHAKFYGKMVEQWNKKYPDKPIELAAIAYPFSDMHNKVLMALNANGEGVPDICDIEVGQFPNFVAGLDTWLLPLDDYMAEYKDDLVQSRIDTYMGTDGKHYGAPFHVGATVMYYNMAEIEAAGLSQKDVDAVKTWDDWAELGRKFMAAQDGEEKYWTEVDTGGTDWMWIAMAESGDDWTGGLEGEPNVNLDSVKKMLTYQKQWLDEGLAEICPEGQIDTNSGKQEIRDHRITSFAKAMWYMSRFISEIPEEEGNWYIAPCPTFDGKQPRSVGIGGTGTVTFQACENKELAAEFICYAKMSPDGSDVIWKDLGFDVCNTSLWDDEKFAYDESNVYNTFFRNKPYEVLNEIKDEIGKIAITQYTTIVNDQMNLTTFNEIFEDGRDVEEAIEEAQSNIELEL